MLGLLWACGSEVPGIDPPASQIRFPVSIRLVPPDDRYLLVANANYDLQFNGGTVTVVDTITGAVEPQHTVRINSFPGQLALRSDGKRAFVASRNPVIPARDFEGQQPLPAGPHLNVIDVDTSATRFLRCTDDPVPQGKIPRCNGRYVTQIGLNPYGLLLREPGPVPVGCGGATESRSESLLVAHVNTSNYATPTNGILSVLESTRTPEHPEGVLPYQVTSTFVTAAGANGLAEHPLTGTIYLSSRYDANVSLLRVQGTRVQTLGTITVRNAHQGIDSRGIAFNPSGTRAYIANRSTPSVLIYDVSCGPQGRELNQLVSIIDVGVDPGAVAYLQRDNGEDRVYVTCATTMEVYVIDPFLNRVDTIIEVGEGAYDITFTRGARKLRGVQRAFVANFQEDSISVIELDPTSPNYHREIARLRASPRLLP
jgi:hypothetical protein